MTFSACQGLGINVTPTGRFLFGGDLGGSWGRGRTDQTDTTTTTTTTTVTQLTVNGTPFVGTSTLPGGPTGTFPQTTTTTAAAATLLATSGKANVNGFMGGGQIGARKQFNIWVLGLEGDIEGSTEHGSFTTCSFVSCPAGSAVGTADFRLNWLGTARGIAGLLVHPQILLYATPGLAVGELDTDYVSGINGGSLAVGGLRGTRTGFAVGAGMEGKIDQHWSVRGQYLFVDLGSVSTNLGGPAITATTTGVVTTNFPQPGIGNVPPVVNTVATTTTATTSSTAAQIRSRLRDHIFKVGFNYQF